MKQLVPFLVVVAAPLAAIADVPLMGAVQVSTGLGHACAVMANGGLKCWGDNARGQLGDGTTTDRLQPVDVPMPGPVIAVAAGGMHTCAVTSAGGAFCWGHNTRGQLGASFVDINIQRSTPQPVTGLSTGVVSIVADYENTCALTAAGAVFCWGRSIVGDGDTNPGDRPTPRQVVGLTANASTVSYGTGHGCAALVTGEVRCWGENLEGSLGNGSFADSRSPVTVTGNLSAVMVSAGYRTTCALTTSGGVKCWGGAVGNGLPIGDHLTPVDVSGHTSGVRSVTVGGWWYSCVVTTASAVRCWGEYPLSGRYEPTSVPIAGLTSGVASVAASGSFLCALMVDSSVRCYGDNRRGQLGDGTRIDRTSAVQVTMPGNQAMTPAQHNRTGLWWNPAESGWGINFTHQGSSLFATLFTYDMAGRDLWLVGSDLAAQNDGSYTGTLYRTSGASYADAAWPGVTVQPAGTMSVRFQSDNSAVVAYSVVGFPVVKTVTPQVFGTTRQNCVNSTATSRASAANYTDLWWNATEPGWGVNLTHQGNVIFATLFTYETDRRDLWLVASSLSRQADGSYSGALYRTTGASFNSATWRAASVTQVGTMRLSFSSGQSGSLQYNYGGRTINKAIARQVFGSPLPLCS